MGRTYFVGGAQRTDGGTGRSYFVGGVQFSESAGTPAGGGPAPWFLDPAMSSFSAMGFDMLIDYHLGQTSVVLRVVIPDSTVQTGAGKTGLTNATAGLNISAIADNEAAATTYTSAGSTIDTIAALGTYAAPTAGHCRFKEVDATNLPGLYEVQLANTRYAVSGAKSLVVFITGATGAAPCRVCIPLRTVNPYDGNNGLTALAGVTAPTAGPLLTAGTGANQVHVDGAGNVPVGGYAAGQDPGTLVFAFASETGGETYLKTVRIMRAVLAGVATDSGGVATFKRADGSTTSLTVAHDGGGNRSSSTPGTN